MGNRVCIALPLFTPRAKTCHTTFYRVLRQSGKIIEHGTSGKILSCRISCFSMISRPCELERAASPHPLLFTHNTLHTDLVATLYHNFLLPVAVNQLKLNTPKERTFLFLRTQQHQRYRSNYQEYGFFERRGRGSIWHGDDHPRGR